MLAFCGKDQLRLRAPVGGFHADARSRISVRDRVSVRGPRRKVRSLRTEREAGSDAPFEVVEANLGSKVLVAEHGRHHAAAVRRQGDREEVRGLADGAERLAVEIEPRQAALPVRLVALVHEPSRVGNRELADPAKRLEGHPFRDRSRGSRRLERLAVEGLREEVSFTHEREVPGLDEAPLAVLPGYERGLAGREVERPGSWCPSRRPMSASPPGRAGACRPEETTEGDAFGPGPPPSSRPPARRPWRAHGKGPRREPAQTRWRRRRSSSPRARPARRRSSGRRRPQAGTRLSLRAAKNPIERLSGDQNGPMASSVPAIGCTAKPSIRRIQSWRFRSDPVAEKTSIEPSGEIAGDVQRSRSISGGSSIEEREREASGARRVRRPAANATAASRSATAHGSQPKRLRRDRQHGRRDAARRAALRDPLQLAAEIPRALPPVLRVLRQRLPDHPVQRRRRRRHHRRHRRRLLLHDRRDQRRLRRPRERLPPRRHLVQHAPEREDVRPPVRFLPLQLLRRHVLERPQDRPFLRQVLARRRAHHRRQRRRPPTTAAAGAIAFARPKSRSFTPVFVSITLPGFRSRCTIP